MSKTRRIAIAGLGIAAKSIHIPAYKKIPNLEIVGGYDPFLPPDNNAYPFPTFQNLASLLDRCKPHILAIAAPTPFHFELAKTGLEYGCHIFCEKPFTTSIQEAETLIDLSRKCSRWIIINNEFRFMNIYQAAKAKIGSAEFGELLFLSANQTFRVTEFTEAGWRGNDPQRTCKEFGIHVLDLCRYFFAEEPQYISARMPKPGNPSGADYLNLIHLEFADGRSAHISLDRLTRGRHRYLDLRLNGSKATIETEFGGNIEFKTGIRGGDRKPYAKFDVSLGGRALLYQAEQFKKIATDPLDIFANATSKLLSEALTSMNEERQPPCSAQDNIKTLALMLAAYESAERNRPVSFSEHWL